MNNVVNIGNVHSHTKGLCCTQDFYAFIFWYVVLFRIFELLVFIITLGRIKTCMIKINVVNTLPQNINFMFLSRAQLV